MRKCFLWFGNSQVSTYLPGEKFVDLRVARHGGAKISGRIAPPRMIATFADKHAALRAQMSD